MKKNSYILLLSASLLSSNAMSGTMGPAQKPWAWVGAISMGPVWQDGGNTQTFYLAPEILKTYVANQSTSTLFDGELFLGVQKRVSQSLHGQLGLAVAATSNANFSGVIWDDADPQFDNFSYRYKVQHTHVAAKLKLLADAGYWLMPWVSASVGVGFNNASSFTSTPLIFEALPTPDFASHSVTTFTYTVGAGVQKAVTDHWQVGVGYEFADWGKSSLGRAFGQTLGDGLTLNHLYTQGLMFNLTYTA